jgi:hypothetical protein
MNLRAVMIRRESAPSVGTPVSTSSTFIHLPYDILGVLTKPDRSPEAGHERWAQYITGDIEPLEHGWYCVKLPDTQNAHPQPPTLLEAREQEYRWFKKTSPWTVLPSQAQRRLGTKRLVRQLESILSNLISKKYAMIYICSGLAVNDHPAEFRRLMRKSRN